MMQCEPMTFYTPGERLPKVGQEVLIRLKRDNSFRVCRLSEMGPIQFFVEPQPDVGIYRNKYSLGEVLYWMPTAALEQLVPEEVI